MHTFKVGDSAIYTTSLGNKFSVLILDVLEAGSYLIRRDGVYYEGTHAPDFRVYDSIAPNLRELKDPAIFTGKGWATLEYRAPEPGDDEKRAIWDAQLKKYEEDIDAKWQSYAHIKEGVTVECYEWNSWTGERFLQFVGKITCIKSDFTFYANDKEGNHRSGRLAQLRVIKDDPSIPCASLAATVRGAAEELVAAHRCGSPNKEPWPKCCGEASAAFSKSMEERHFKEKLNL